ncbi:hypothetical protein GCM10027074_45130 [Streptomyces deserti]
MAGQSGLKPLIKSDAPERETRKREPGKAAERRIPPTGNRVRKDLIELEAPKGSARRKAARESLG